MGSLKGGLGLIWGGLISGGLRVFKGMLFVCFGLDIGFAAGLGLASLDLGLGQAQLRVFGCA